MRYMFRILALGDIKISLPFIVNAGVETDEESAEMYQEEVYVLDTELNLAPNTCNLEILVPRKDSVNFDEIIPTTDGILYYLDPSDQVSLELYQMVEEILGNLGRYIPTVVVFIKRDQFMPIPWNLLLESFWRSYPRFEAVFYSFGSRKPTSLPLEILSTAMIQSNVPINGETAWMRLPVYVDMTNQYAQAEEWERASICAEIAYRLSLMLNLSDNYLYAERTAYLYSRNEDFLQASKIMANIDPRMSERFRNIYVDNQIRVADTSFKQKRYKDAAQKYETAANWSKIELGHGGKEYEDTAFERAVESWISACEFDQALRVMEKLDHEKKHEILDSITPRIVSAADFLISIDRLDVAKIQLYLVVDTYQREGKFESLKTITQKIQDVLTRMFHAHLELREMGPARLVLDEIENITETFELTFPDLDQDIARLAQLFIENSDFKKVDELIPKIKSKDLQQDVTKSRMDQEDQLERIRKETIAKDLERGYQRLNAYLGEEERQFNKLISDTLEEARQAADHKDYLTAGSILEKRGQWFSNFKLEEQAEETNRHAIEFYIQGLKFDTAIRLINELSPRFREKFLKPIIPMVETSCGQLFAEKGLQPVIEVLETFIKIYRNLLLYEESKRLANLQIDFLKQSAVQTVDDLKSIQTPQVAIEKALQFMKQANEVSEAYLDGENIYEDKVYANITNMFIELGDMVNAEASLQKIRDKSVYTEIHDKILKIESDKSEAVTRVAQQRMEDGMLQEQITLLRNRAREREMTKMEDFKKRVALKRRYYARALESLENGNYDSVITEYEHSMNQLLRRKQMEDAGLCLLAAGLGEYVQTSELAKTDEILLSQVKELGAGAEVFNQTFSIRVLRFLIEMKRQGQQALFIQAMILLDNLPLFQAELDLVNKITGNTFTALDEGSVLGTRTREVTPQVSSTTEQTETKLTDRQDETKRKLDIQKTQMQLEQKFAAFNQQKRDIQMTAGDILQSRTGLKRAFFRKVLENLENDNWAGAAEAYRESVEKLHRRKDIAGSGVALALGTVCLLHAGKALKDVKSYLESGLKDMALNEKVVRNTFHIQLIVSILKAKKISEEAYVGRGWRLLELFPLFNEEKKLLTRPASL